MKMKKILYILMLTAVSCTHRELCHVDHSGGPAIPTMDVNVIINWDAEETQPAQGMRINLFPLSDTGSRYADDLPSDGGKVKLTENADYFCLAYDYFGSTNIYFRSENDRDFAEAYCAPMTRATYTRAFPNQVTVAEPAGPFYIDRVQSFVADGTGDLNYYPDDVLETFTFEIRGVVGAQYITATRGAITGMSGSYFLATGLLAMQPSTVFFSAVKDGPGEKITGSFSTFGSLDLNNDFTIEILYPSGDNGIVQATWDVTEKVRAAQHIPGTPDIIIENDKIAPIIPSGDGGSGFDANVEEWDREITVPLPV